MSGIAWLASYPKSGNTWCRSFLTAYTYGELDVNHLVGAPIAGARKLIDRWSGASTMGLPKPRVESIRPQAYRALARHCRERGVPTMLKVHDWWKLTPSGEPLFPHEATHRAVLLVRDPRDVAVSFAHHLGKPVAKLVNNLSQPAFALAWDGPSLEQQVTQTLNTWSVHFESWVDDSELYVYVIRYEDAKKDPAKVWRGLLDYLGYPFDPERFQLALELSDFRHVKAQEQAAGFKEASKSADTSFFRKGVVGAHKDEMTPEDAAKICVQHGRVMRRLGYLPAIAA
jgi:aryl sulfotransferase